MKPFVFLNFKTYEQGTGDNAFKLTNIAEEAALEGNVELAIIAQVVDIRMLARNSKLKIFAQHADLDSYGAHTGKVTIEALKQAGAAGIMLNHSENRISMDLVKRMVKRCKELEMPVLVCVANLKEAKEVLKLKPEYLALEDPKLIGSGKSITEYKPDEVLKFVELVKGKAVALCGAGISSSVDFIKALEMGNDGVLLASAYVKSDNPKEMLFKFLGI